MFIGLNLGFYFGNVSSTEIALGEQRDLYCRRVNNTNTTADGLEGII